MKTECNVQHTKSMACSENLVTAKYVTFEKAQKTA